MTVSAGIFGVVARSERAYPSLGLIMERMERCYAERYHAHTRVIDAGVCRIGVFAGRREELKRNLHIYQVGKEKKVLGVEGTIWGTNDTTSENGQMKIDEIARLLEEKGLQGVPNLKGHYNGVYFDGESKELSLFTCRHGLRYIYYILNDDLLAFSSHAPALIDAQIVGARNIDYAAVADMMLSWKIHGDRTFHKDIKLFPHGSYLRVTSEHSQFVRYWDYPFSRRENLSLDDAKEQMNSTFRKAVERYFYLPYRWGCMLSGGLDSRFICAQISRLGHKVPTFHIVRTDNWKKELAIAKEAASKLNFPFHPLSFEAFDPAQDFQTGLDNTDGLTVSQQFWFLPIVREIKENGDTNGLFDGYSLDALVGSSFLWESDERDTRKALKRHVLLESEYANKKELFPLYRQLLNEEVFGEMEQERIEKRIEDTVAHYPSENLQDLIHYYSMLHRARRYVLGFSRALGSDFLIAYPSMDYDFTDFWLSLPIKFLQEAHMFRSLYCSHFPDLAKIPWAKTGYPLSIYPRSKSRAMRLKKVFVPRIKNILSRASKGRIEVAPPFHEDRRFRKDPRFRDAIKTYLDNDLTYSRGVIKQEGIKRLFSLIDSGRNWGFSIIYPLITIEGWFRYFDEA